jgi:hypothetical protein
MKKIITILILLAWFAANVNATVRYVKQDAAGTGTGSWGNASGDLQAVINASASGDEIWVAAGTYIPNRKANATGTITTNDRDNAFVLKQGVKIYGGFAPTGTPAWAERNWVTKVTTLSGNSTCYHVVVSAVIASGGTTVLDGFTITGGNADVNSTLEVNGKAISRRYGGGIFNYSSSPTLANLTISGNAAVYGGGIYNYSSSPTLTNLTISGNAATTGYGGGIYNYESSSPTLTNVTISGNTANGGGGITNFSSSLTLINVTISGNIATLAGTGSGGGIYNNSSGTVNLQNSIVSGNTAATAPDCWVNTDGSSINAFYSLIGNTASGTGIAVTLGSGCITTNPQFVSLVPATAGNPTTGGNYRLQSTSPAINTGNNTYNTTALDLAGFVRIVGTIDMGAYEYGSALPTVINIAAIPGITIPVAGATPVTTITATTQYTGTVSWSPNHATFTAKTAYTATITLTPKMGYTLTGVAANFFTVTGATSVSNSANSGVITAVFPPILSTRYVKTGGSGNGSDWAHASGDLQAMINASVATDTIFVAAGTYKPNSIVNTNGNTNPTPGSNRDWSFVLKQGVKIYGRFAGTETAIAERDLSSNLTILSGDTGTTDDISDNCYHVVIGANITNATVLDGFTITGGNANVGSGSINVNTKSIFKYKGGGIYMMLHRPCLPTLPSAEIRQAATAAEYIIIMLHLPRSPTLPSAEMWQPPTAAEYIMIIHPPRSPTLSSAEIRQATAAGYIIFLHLPRSPTLPSAEIRAAGYLMLLRIP